MTVIEQAVFAAAYIEYMGGCGEPASDEHCDAAYAHAARVVRGFIGAADRDRAKAHREIEAHAAKSAEGTG